MKSFAKIMILSLLILTIVAGCKKQVFDGSVTGNGEQFLLEYSILNTTKTHQLELKEDSIVDVVIENKSGRLDVLMANIDGQEIYRGDDASSGKFSIKIPKSRTYKISVTGKNAKGSVSFKVRK